MRSTLSLAKDLESLAETYRGKDRNTAMALYQSACRLRDQMRETLRLEDEMERLQSANRKAEKRADMIQCEVDHLQAEAQVRK